VPNLRTIVTVALLSGCTIHSELQLARPYPNVESRDGTCAEQHPVEPIVRCEEYRKLSPGGVVAIVVGGLAVASLLVIAGLQDISEGLGKADDH
jgi:hypothetical protein